MIGGGGRVTHNLISVLKKTAPPDSLILATSGDKERRIHRDNLITYESPLLSDLYKSTLHIPGVFDFLEGIIQKERPTVIHSFFATSAVPVNTLSKMYPFSHIVTHLKTPEYKDNGFVDRNDNSGRWLMYDMPHADSDITYIQLSNIYKKFLYQSIYKIPINRSSSEYTFPFGCSL